MKTIKNVILFLALTIVMIQPTFAAAEVNESASFKMMDQQKVKIEDYHRKFIYKSINDRCTDNSQIGRAARMAVSSKEYFSMLAMTGDWDCYSNIGHYLVGVNKFTFRGAELIQALSNNGVSTNAFSYEPGGGTIQISMGSSSATVRVNTASASVLSANLSWLSAQSDTATMKNKISESQIMEAIEEASKIDPGCNKSVWVAADNIVNGKGQTRKIFKEYLERSK